MELWGRILHIDAYVGSEDDFGSEAEVDTVRAELPDATVSELARLIKVFPCCARQLLYPAPPSQATLQCMQLVQVPAMVCSKFAAAAGLSPSLQQGLDLTSADQANLPQMNSALLLQWAPVVTLLHVADAAMAFPGLPEFLAACTKLYRVTLKCNSMIAAAQADHLLAAMSYVAWLDLSGLVMPCILPPTVRYLTAGILCEDCEDTDRSDQQADALLHRAARLPSLRHLTLKFSSAFPAPMDIIALTCPSQISGLQVLTVGFDLAEQTHVDLSWLHRLPPGFGGLHLELSVLTEDLDQHAMLVQQLGKLRLNSLLLIVHSPWPYAVQKLWASIGVWRLWIIFTHLTGEGSVQELLRVLPPADDYTIHAEGPGKLCIAWSALTSHAAKISVAMRASAELQIVGADPGPPEHLQEPWRLWITSDQKAEGLPRMEDMKGSLYCRNNAARQQFM